MSESPDLPSIDARSGDGLDRMAVAGSGVIPRKATLEARYSPRIAAAVANPLAGRGTQYRSRRTTPRSSHRTPAPGPIASGDAPNRTRAGCCFVVERASCGAPTDRSPDTQVRLATPAGAAIATGDAVVRAGGSARLHPWRTSSQTVNESNSAASDVSLAPLRSAHHPAVEDQDVESGEFIWVSQDSTVRLFRMGAQPPLRGTLVTLESEYGLLYNRGAVEYYGTYPGMYVPRPIALRPAVAERPMTELAPRYSHSRK